jgi:hypothetical protein
MKCLWKPVILATIVSLVFVEFLFAHQPRLVGNETDVIVSLPEISKAYYGQLTGKPVIYHIEATEPFRLYVNILVPDLENIEKDVSVKILRNETVISLLDGSGTEWTKFYEPFAGDAYYRGPEYVAMQDAGTYQIHVFSPDNLGKYVLAVGDREAFPFSELVRTYAVLPQLKSDFFGKSPFTAYFNRMGIFLGILIFIGLVIAGCIFWGVRFIKRRLCLAHQDEQTSG